MKTRNEKGEAHKEIISFVIRNRVTAEKISSKDVGMTKLPKSLLPLMRLSTFSIHVKRVSG